jgi:glycosyltransferase involved in cell wall biosynthesis
MPTQTIRKPLKFASPTHSTHEILVKPEQPKAKAAEIPFNPDLKTVLFVVRDKGGCGFYRCAQPASHLRLRGLMNTIVDFKNTTREHILQADIIVFQETGSSISLDAMNFAMQNKKPVVVETDDFLHKVSPHNEGGYGAWNPATLYIHRFSAQIMRANAMTVSTNQLAREYFPYNGRIYVLPNFLNESIWSLQQTKKSDGLIRIGWAGGNAHLDDLKMISKVIEKIVRDYKGKVKFETMGMIKPELQGVFGNLEEFHEVCPKCNYQGESITWTGESLDNYPVVLASHGWDIAVAPVINESFGNCKSDIKLKEYSAVGFPIVASKVVPYKEAKKDGCHVLLAESFDEWYNQIKELIEKPELREEIRKANKQWVSGKWIGDNIKLYAEVYQQIIADSAAVKKE